MAWLILIAVTVLLLGPLRPWVGRHWAFLLSVTAGAGFGWALGSWVLATCGGRIPYLPLAWAVVAAAALAGAGPAWLRKIERDGKEE